MPQTALELLRDLRNSPLKREGDATHTPASETRPGLSVQQLSKLRTNFRQAFALLEQSLSSPDLPAQDVERLGRMVRHVEGRCDLDEGYTDPADPFASVSLILLQTGYRDCLGRREGVQEPQWTDVA